MLLDWKRVVNGEKEKEKAERRWQSIGHLYPYAFCPARSSNMGPA